MTPREAMKVLSAGVTSKEVEAERVLLRTIEQYEAAKELVHVMIHPHEPKQVNYWGQRLSHELTKGNP